MAPRITEFRRHLHAHPELSMEEFRTTEYIAHQLEADGISFRFGPDGRGVIVDLGASGGSRIALRADCDALPIQEENAIPYASIHPGAMHACGHDAHSAMLLGALLALHRADLRLPVRGIFQPAEEAGDGALGMIAAGALDDVSAIIALHVDPNLPVGHAAAVPGQQSASCQDFQITVHGRGGHAARPHLCIDPVAITAALIGQIYQAIPRRVDSRKPTVVSICKVRAGHATNVIPDSAELSGTIRSLDAHPAHEARECIERICHGMAASFGATITPVFERRIPGVINDPALTLICAAAAEDVFGQDAVVTSGEASMGAEDFADYLQVVPGCMMRLGVRFNDREITPLHTPTFDLDERALIPGSRLLLRALWDLEKVE